MYTVKSLLCKIYDLAGIYAYLTTARKKTYFTSYEYLFLHLSTLVITADHTTSAICTAKSSIASSETRFIFTSIEDDSRLLVLSVLHDLKICIIVVVEGQLTRLAERGRLFESMRMIDDLTMVQRGPVTARIRWSRG